MKRTIGLDELKVGDYVHSVDVAWICHPLKRFRIGIIRSGQEIEKLRRAGVKKVVVEADPRRRQTANRPLEKRPGEAAQRAMETPGRGRDPGRIMGGAEPRVPLEEELPVASALYTATLKHIKDMFAQAKSGKIGGMGESSKLVGELLESVMRNPDAISILTKLKTGDEYTYCHCLNLCALSMVYGRYLGLAKGELHLLGLAGLLHDIGKARIPLDILQKPGPLTDEEFTIMKGHPLAGAELLEGRRDVRAEILDCILEHHERADGSGYPSGKTLGEISRYARIISLVDVYDALTSDRVYRVSMLPHKALKIIYECRESTFKADEVEHFIKCLGIYPVTSLVRLSNGQIGIVCEVNPQEPLKPKIKVILSRDQVPVRHRLVDLGKEPEPGGGHVDLRILDCVDPQDFRLNLEKYIH